MLLNSLSSIRRTVPPGRYSLRANRGQPADADDGAHQEQPVARGPGGPTAATRMLANGADLHTVQRMSTWRNIRTTLRYLHLVPEQLQEKMRLFSPLSGIGEERRRMVPTRLKRVK
jgi:hypothetical protein